MENTTVPFIVDPSDDFYQKIVKNIIGEKDVDGFESITYAILVNSDPPNVLVLAKGLSEIFCVSPKNLARVSLVDRLYKDSPGPRCFPGDGSTVGDVVRDIDLEEDRISPLDLGRLLSTTMEISLKRKELEEMSGVLHEGAKFWVEATKELSRQQSSRGTAPAKEIVDFTKRFGRPPYPGMVEWKEPGAKKSGLLNEALSLTPISLDMFGQKLELFKPVPFRYGEKEKLCALSKISGRGLVLTFFSPPGNSKGEVAWKQEIEFPDATTAECLKNRSDSYNTLTFRDAALFEFCKKNSLETYVGILRECKKHDVVFHDFTVAEFMVGRGERNLRDEERAVLFGVLQKRSMVSFREETIFDGQKPHKLAVVEISRSRSDSKTLPARGEFVLGIDGQVQTGRFVLGGAEAMRKKNVLNTLSRSAKTARMER